MLCPQCRRPISPSRFEVYHFGIDGKLKAKFQLCSLICVGKWAIAYGLQLAGSGFRFIMKGLPPIGKGK